MKQMLKVNKTSTMQHVRVNCSLRSILAIILKMNLFQLAILQQPKETGTRYFKYQAVPDCREGFYHGKILNVINSKSVVECGMRCGENVQCQSFNFDTGSPEINQPSGSKCYLLEGVVNSCDDLKTVKDWIYLREIASPEAVDAAKTGDASMTKPTPPEPSAKDKICQNPESCSNWEEVYELYSKGPRGDKKALIAAVKNGASVRVAMELQPGFRYYYVPVEYAYDDDESELYFYFGPIYFYDTKQTAKNLLKSYTAMSTKGVYTRTVYTKDSFRTLDIGGTGLLAKFFIKYTNCYENGDAAYTVSSGNNGGVAGMTTSSSISIPGPVPSISSGTNEKNNAKYTSLDTLVTPMFNDGGIPTVRLGSKAYSRYFKGRWSFLDSNNMKIGTLKSRGEFYPHSSDLKVGDPLKNDFQIISTDGSVTTLMRDLNVRGNAPSEPLTTNTKQIWFMDSCWTMVGHTNTKGDFVSFSGKQLREQVVNGADIQVGFTVEDIVYNTGAPLVICDKQNCDAILEVHPKLDTSDPFSFHEDTNVLYTSEIVKAKLISGTLDGLNNSTESVEVFWYVDTLDHNTIFYATYLKVKQDDLSIHVHAGVNLRLVIREVSGRVLSYAIEEAIELSGGIVQLHTAHITSATHSPYMCKNDTPSTVKLVLENTPFDFKLVAWSWDYKTLCTIQPYSSFASVSVQASTSNAALNLP